MEFTPIDSESIIISLSAIDMKKLGISNSSFNYESTSGRKTVWFLLDKAKTKTGFDGASAPITISMLESKDGGCELFIHKGARGEGADELSYTKESYKASSDKRDYTETYVYYFEELSAITNACKQIRAKGFSGESSAYFGEIAGRCGYFLVLTDSQRSTPARPLKRFSFLSEFGQKYEAAFANAYISEHCDCICPKNAVDIISKSC